MRPFALLAAGALLVTALPALATVRFSGTLTTPPQARNEPAPLATLTPEAVSLPDIIVDLAPPESAPMPDIVVDGAAPMPDIIVDGVAPPITQIVPNSTVPDAATWALMITGLLAVGGVLRRRKTVVLS